MSTSRAATPEAPTLEPPGPITSTLSSLSVTHRIQRSSSDMILESDTEVPPPSGSYKGVADENMILNDGAQQPKRKPRTEPTPEPQIVTPTGDFHEKQMVGETPMPLVRNSPLTSLTKRNPFTESRTFLNPQYALPSLARSTAIPDVGSLSLHSPTVYGALNRDSAVTSHAPQEKSSMRKTYIFSATEIRTLVASRGSEEGFGPNKLGFYLDLSIMNGITKWRNFKSGQG